MTAPSPIFTDTLFTNLPDHVFEDTVKFRTLTNTRGLKGQIGKFFYLVGVEDRRYEYALQFVDTDSAGLTRDSTISIPTQFFYEGTLVYKGKFTRLKFNAKLNNVDLYQLKFGLNLPFAEVRAKKIRFQPSLFQTAYRGNFMSVNLRDSLKNTQVMEVEARLKFNLFKNRLYIEPFFKYQHLESLIYRDSLSQVQQFLNRLKHGKLASQSIGRVDFYDRDLASVIFSKIMTRFCDSRRSGSIIISTSTKT